MATKPKGDTLGELVQEKKDKEEKSLLEKLDDYIYNNPIDLGGGGVTEDGKVNTTKSSTTTTSSTDTTPVDNTPAPEPVDPREEAINALRAELKDWGGTTEQINALLNSISPTGKGPSENYGLYESFSEYTGPAGTGFDAEGNPDPDGKYASPVGGKKTDKPDNIPTTYVTEEGEQGPLRYETSVENITTLTQTLKDVPQEDRMVYLIDNFGGADGVIQEWGGVGGTQAVPLNDATRAQELQKPSEQKIQEAVDRQVLGSSTGEGLEENEDGSFTDPETGNTFYRGDDGRLTDREGNVRYDPGTGLAAEIERNQEQQTLAEQNLYGTDGVVSDITQTASDYGDFADQTRQDLADPANDFALQFTEEINKFLQGDGEGKGFLDYQSDLLGAGETYKGQMQVLSQEYDQAYKENQADINRIRGDYASLTEGYANQLNPLRNDLRGVRDRLGQVSEKQMGVADDAADRDYYGRLRDTLYADSADALNRQTEAGMDSIRQNFAASGADPNSPAFVAAMKDLQQGRSDAMVGARRKAILDSFGRGTQMLGNRQQALSGAGAALGAEGAAVGAEMGALDSLYGMKASGLQADANLTGQQMQNRMQGLNTRSDMIGNLYNIDRTNAQTGMEGLNTILNANTNAINTRANQFYKNVGLESDLYGGQMDMLGKSANAVGNQLSYFGGQKDKAFNTLLEANQGKKSDAFSFGTLQQMYEKEGIEMPDFVKNSLPK